MSVRAAAVILTDTKSLSRFSVMKFSSANVQLSSVSHLPLLSFKKGALLLSLRASLSLSHSKFARLASFPHSRAHFGARMHACTQRQVAYVHIYRQHTFHLAPSWWGCYIWTHLFMSVAAEKRRGPTPWVQSDWQNCEGIFQCGRSHRKTSCVTELNMLGSWISSSCPFASLHWKRKRIKKD